MMQRKINLIYILIFEYEVSPYGYTMKYTIFYQRQIKSKVKSESVKKFRGFTIKQMCVMIIEIYCKQGGKVMKRDFNDYT